MSDQQHLRRTTKCCVPSPFDPEVEPMIDAAMGAVDRDLSFMEWDAVRTVCRKAVEAALEHHHEADCGTGKQPTEATCPHGHIITDGACYECCPFGDGSGDAPDCGHDDCPEHSTTDQPTEASDE